MKTKTLITMLLVLCFAVPTQAQFLKNLGKKVEKAAERSVERTIERRTEKEVSQKTDKTIDVATGKDSKKKKKDKKKKSNKNKGIIIGDTEKNASNERDDAKAKTMQKKMQSMMGGGAENIPNQYSFSYKAVMKITTHKEEMEMEYWLQPDAQYFGSKVDDGQTNNISVMDLENETMVMFMNQGGQKMMMPIQADKKMYKKIKQQSNQVETSNLTGIESKTILGYHCNGNQMKDKDGTYKMWITNETPVGFIGSVANTDYMPSGVLPLGKNSMVMEMQFEPNRGKKKQFNMRCTEFTKEKKDIVKSEYKTMGGF